MLWSFLFRVSFTARSYVITSSLATPVVFTIPSTKSHKMGENVLLLTQPLDVICPNYHGSLLLLLPDGCWTRLVALTEKHPLAVQEM